MNDSTQPQPPAGENADARDLLAFVANRDEACPACGYNLRMLSKPLCPECGLALKLTVGSDAPYKRAWAITLILNAMVAGAGLFFLLITTVAGGPSLDSFNEYLWYIGPMVWIPAPLIIMGLRKWFCRQQSKIPYLFVVLSVLWLCVLGISLMASIH